MSGWVDQFLLVGQDMSKSHKVQMSLVGGNQ